ncbi:MAG TPA: DUF11 domain-containing protein [Chloroflexi bacterium]|nr:DUF11 domain-containing protein [Chloroflexota bacterium]
MAFLLTVSSVRAALPPPVQIYYVPVPEDQVFAALSSIYPGPAACSQPAPGVVAPIYTYLALSIISGDTLIYYDQWEDDFEIDIAAPTQPTTQIWGDGNPANGAPPGIPSDLLAPDTVIILSNPIDPATRGSVLAFDGGDKLGATRPVAFSRATWSSTYPTGPGTLLADAVEVYDTSRWGVRYETPVGEDTISPQLFEYTGLAIMAQEDGTVVQLDFDRNGVAESSVTLAEGQSHLVNGGAPAGAVITASAPVQVTLITGDRCDIYESRWYALFPRDRWSAEYYNPVGTPTDGRGTRVFLFNPDTAPLTVNWETQAGAQPPLTLAAGGVISTVAPAGSGTRFYAADGRPFQAIAAVGANSPPEANSASDWGFSLIPERLLTYQVLVGWGAGRDPTSSVNPTENGSPVWVTTELPPGQPGPVRVCVDYDGDGQGPLIDAYGFRYDLLLTLTRLQSATVYDPDGDQTGMTLYVCDPPAAPTNARIAAAWGQEPGVASAAEPGLDLGTAAPPAATFAAGKGVEVVNDRNQDGRAGPGDTLRYTVIARNASRVPLGNVVVSDTVPVHTSYVLASTFFDSGASVTPIPDNGVGTPFPLDAGGVNLGALPVRGVFTVTFDVRVDRPLSPTVDRVHNLAYVTIDEDQRTPEVETEIVQRAAVALVKRTNGEDAAAPPGPILAVGAPVTWTYTLTNTGDLTLTGVAVTDSVPGVTPIYVSGDNGDGQLAPDERWLYQAQGTAIAGQYANVGVARGLDPAGNVISASNPSHYFGLLSDIHLDKSAAATNIPPGTVITYTFTVTNGGNAALTSIALTDDHCAPGFVTGDGNANSLLDLGETWRYACAVTVSADITNTAVVSGTDALARRVTDAAQAYVNVLTPAIVLTKTPSALSVYPGAVVTYTYLAANTGEAALYGAALTDDRCAPISYVDGDAALAGVLEVGETWRYQCRATIVRDTRNIATVTATDVAGNPVTATAAAFVQTPFLYLPIILAPVECPPPDGCPVPGVNELKGLAVHPTTGVLYITSRANDRLLALNPFQFQVFATATTGDQPWGVAVDPIANRVYVASYGSGDVRVYDAATLALLATIPVGPEATLVETLPDLGAAFVLVHNGSRVAVIEGLTRTAELTAGGSGPFGIAADHARGQVFVSNRDSGHFATISRIDGAWVTRSNLLLSDGRRLFEIAYDAARNRLYNVYLAADQSWYVDAWKPEPWPALWGREATVAVESSGAITSPLVGGAGLTVNPATGYVYNANTAAGTVSVLEAGGGRVRETIPTLGDPFALAADGARNYVYIGLRTSGRLIILK